MGSVRLNAQQSVFYATKRDTWQAIARTEVLVALREPSNSTVHPMRSVAAKDMQEARVKPCLLSVQPATSIANSSPKRLEHMTMTICFYKGTKTTLRITSANAETILKPSEPILG